MVRKVIGKFMLSATAVTVAPFDITKCKRTELPLYAVEAKPEPEPKGPKAVKAAAAPPQNLEPPKPSEIEEAIRKVRETLMSVAGDVRSYQDLGTQYVNDGVDQAQWLVNYLGEENNVAPKAPAIAIGGLTGFIFALRGGTFRKLLFTTVGVLGMASVCYPSEAHEYGTMALTEGKKYARIGYNFIYGVKKGDTPLELPTLPPMPGSITEAWSLVSSSFGKSSPSVSEPELVGIEGGTVQLENGSEQKRNAKHKPIIAEQVPENSCACKGDGTVLQSHSGSSGAPAPLPYPPPVESDTQCVQD